MKIIDYMTGPCIQFTSYGSLLLPPVNAAKTVSDFIHYDDRYPIVILIELSYIVIFTDFCMIPQKVPIYLLAQMFYQRRIKAITLRSQVDLNIR